MATPVCLLHLPEAVGGKPQRFPVLFAMKSQTIGLVLIVYTTD